MMSEIPQGAWTVRRLIDRLQEIENHSLPILIHDPYSDEFETWILDDFEPVRYVPGHSVRIHMGAKLSEAEDHN
jgi:hypothetical protein